MTPVALAACGIIALIVLQPSAEAAPGSLQEQYSCPASLGRVGNIDLTLDSPRDAGRAAPWAGRAMDFRAGCSYTGGQARIIGDWSTGATDLGFGCADFLGVPREQISSNEVVVKSMDRRAQARAIGTNSALRDAARPHVASMLGFAEGRTAVCDQRSGAAPATVPTRSDRSRETLESLGVSAELLTNPQRLASMLGSGQLTPGEVRALERGWRERAETFEVLTRAWARLLADRELIAVALSSSSVSADGGPPSYFSVDISTPDGERSLIALDLFSPEERFHDPRFVLLPGFGPGHLMALIPEAELRARLAGAELVDAALFPLSERQIALVLDGAEQYRDHARDNRFARRSSISSGG